MKRTGFWMVMVWIPVFLRAQSPDVKGLLQEVAFYSDVMVNAAAAPHRIKASEGLQKSMDALMAMAGSMDVHFDSIPWISEIRSGDVRVVTWQLRISDDEYRYSGFVQKGDAMTPLRDSRPFVNGAMYSFYLPSAWYGALYYDMIPFDHEGETMYAIFGFHAQDHSVNTKLVDVLTFGDDKVQLGAPVFTGKGQPMNRLMLTYSDASTVHIRYDSLEKAIVHDHLVGLAGVAGEGEMIQVSDGSLEGWELKDGRWVYYEEMYDVPQKEPPMTDDRKERKEEKDIMGRPRKQ